MVRGLHEAWAGWQAQLRVLAWCSVSWLATSSEGAGSWVELATTEEEGDESTEADSTEQR